MALPDPTTLSAATRFRPAHFRSHSRSPSRSPVRKAKFTSQHLDPLLSNLSPESTLKALHATETIPSGSSEGVLSRSISDASTEEREIGIRAAFAAQQLKGWRREISSWQWPARRERELGAGFMPPESALEYEDGIADEFIGCLPVRLLNEYDERLEDIKDGLESLEMDDLKDHVLTAHASSRPPPAARQASDGVRGSYGRMRDFTALVTATVIQALPDLAMVNALIDVWDVRIAVLRELPLLLDLFGSTREILGRAVNSCRDQGQRDEITRADVDRISAALGPQIQTLGRHVDKLLDLLEGHEDSLPQAWIDWLENMELEYARWKAEASEAANHNEARLSTTDDAGNETTGIVDQPVQPSKLNLKVPAHSRHKREISEVSIADSVLSDMSIGEVVDARKSQIMLPSTIQVVDSKPSSPIRPTAIQRASTASIEVISNSQLKRLDVRRSMSADLLAKMAMGNGTPPRQVASSTDSAIDDQETPRAELESPDYFSMADRRKSTSALSSPSAVPSPSLMVAPLKVQTQFPPHNGRAAPLLPRRSSKRASFGTSTALSPIISASTNDIVSPVSPSDSPLRAPVSPVSPSKANGQGASLDDKIQNILENLPSKIRLGDSRDPDQSQASSTGSTRSSTPTPALIPEMTKPTRRGAAEPDIRIYHLHQNGPGRDLKPIKLFVRAVGENGERVMVRVGGGWADLAEYLREYSAHHGSRSASDNLLEVAQYPVKTERTRKASSQILAPTQPKLPSPATLKARRRSLSTSSSGSRSRSPSPPPAEKTTAPPVPPIPASYTMYTPIMTVSTNRNGETETTFEDGDPTAKLEAKGRKSIEPEAGPYSRSASIQVPGVSTNTTVASPAAIDPTKYTPLGGAGPKGAKNRSATYGAVEKNNDAWVEGMVGKARAVSNTIHGPTTTTTTTVTTSVPASRRVSHVVNPGPQQKTAPTPTQKVAAPPSPGDGQGLVRRKSRLGLGDVSGIKRVFLRRKSTK
ncbi:uncharacterized protein AB675_9193 [Cyphellophora attinorum]|uniref:GAR domain-containing protein n=1 Tax=Cyphellophora attinorum TaxID=1664694 RepID=A0A0N1HVV8_9EURO|nr:uncharacterized protein AB675_9193 [Phialophora attinorum]KPI41545.1 hypothetical protein AB675_9193 [Phialophora attinorum]